ncbi:interleukin-27 subunit beta [Aplochiton taeniatus]
MTSLLGGVFCSNDLEPVEETKDMYVTVGFAVSVNCVESEMEPVGVQWRLDGQVFQPGPLLALHNVSLEDRGIYTCHGPRGELLLRLALKPGHPPSKPKVRCWSPTYPTKAHCTWKEQTLSLSTHYIATYSDDKKLVTKQCRILSDPGSLSANLLPSSPPGMVCLLDDLAFFTSYLVNITAVNPLGRASSILSFMVEDIVKPDPPVEVHVAPETFNRLSVKWAPPPTWSNLDFFPLKYKLQFHWENDGSVGPYESTCKRLRLVPGRTYSIQVCAMELLDLGECSAWTTPVRTTMPRQR